MSWLHLIITKGGGEDAIWVTKLVPNKPILTFWSWIFRQVFPTIRAQVGSAIWKTILMSGCQMVMRGFRYSRSPSPYKHYSRSRSVSRSLSRSHSRGRESIEVENPGNILYVTGLSPRITKRELEKHFSSDRMVVDVHLVVDPWTRESCGFGFVTMSTIEEPDRCVKYLDHSVLEGRVITVEKIPFVKELRKLMRIQALRCHVIHCQNGTRLNVIPVLASRSQALRGSQEQQAQPHPEEISLSSWYPPSAVSSPTASRPSTPSSSTFSSFNQQRPSERAQSRSHVSLAEAASIINVLKDKK